MTIFTAEIFKSDVKLEIDVNIRITAKHFLSLFVLIGDNWLTILVLNVFNFLADEEKNIFLDVIYTKRARTYCILHDV